MSSRPTPKSKASSSNGTFSNVKTYSLAALLLLWITYLHLSGLYLFTKGFLLTRLALSDINTCDSTTTCTLVPTHKKAVLIIIDALRFDFISPSFPSPSSANHHGVLTLPSELSLSQPDHSIIFNAYSDPPTTTLQRLKGLTTGSLPTFIDAGSNFAGQAIEEDSWILQLARAGKKVGFMGDNTWLSIFPDGFDGNLTFPFDSFNVEDLHSVDEGVTQHLLPLLESERSGEWDVLIAHFLGVDHVGHRVGPSNPTMKTKLEQMDDVLRDIVDKLDDETVLIVLGDHGMDQKGDHGGDGELETSSALWIYSKGPSISPPSSSSSSPTVIFPGTTTPYRSVQQIDLVPTLSLLLGLPIPYNNLGSIIPEVFPDEAVRGRAAKINAEQVWRYLKSYEAVSGKGRELERGMAAAKKAWLKVEKLEEELYEEDELEGMAAVASEEGVGSRIKQLFAGASNPSARQIPLQAPSSSSSELLSSYTSFTRVALEQCRLLWAQFNFTLMSLGLCILLLSIPTLWTVYVSIARERSGWEVWAQRNLNYAYWGAVGGGAMGYAFGAIPKILGVAEKSVLSSAESTIYAAALASQLAVVVPGFLPAVAEVKTRLRSFGLVQLIGPILLVIHAVGLSTNSFILWEDRITLYFLISASLVFLVQAPSAPTPHLRLRIIGYTLLFAGCVRLSGISTICREENMGYCRVTFYEGASIPVSPSLLLFLSFPAAWFLPVIVESFLGISKSYAGLAPLIVGRVWRACLLGGTVYWLLERGETWDELQPARIPLVKWLKTMLARTVIGTSTAAGYVLWQASPLNIEVRRAGDNEEEDKKLEQEDDGNPLRPPPPRKGQILVLGFANSYGSSYLLFVLPFFSLLWLVAQPTGQIVLALTLISVLALLEIIDSQRDSLSLTRAFALTNPADFDPSSTGTMLPPTFTETSLFALLSLLLFYTTGHQPVLSSIQWSSAFIGFETVTYPFSPLLVGLNTWGPLLLLTFLVPLLGQWNVSPKPKSYVPALPDSLKAVLGFALYQATVVISTATWAAWHRRHLMVWKVFAPRFMVAGVGLVVVDLGLVLAVGVGMRVVGGKVKKTFATAA
ncbi:hypothetical protein BDY24DRAFT_381198 [Mrakia frigida]|uniref:GPI ethanolamine phosphate transferase 3 n=1 Tax=Mrakia frigida TaxID=29902 RepID=UPI003FCBF0BE